MRKLWQWLTKQTLRGLLLLVPLVVTIEFIIWLGRTVENSLRPLFEFLLPQGWYVPGLAIVLFLLSALLLGLMTRHVLLRKTLEITEHWMTKLPIVSSIYPVVRQLTDLLSGKGTNQGGSVVLVTLPDSTKVIGIVTRPAGSMQLSWVPPECDLVFVPMSYQVGGFTFILPRTQLEPLDMTPGEALQMMIMGGIVQPKSPRSDEPARPA